MLISQPSPVLVTGGAGYIGSHAVLALLDSGFDVIVLDNLTTGFRHAVDPRATFVNGDIADADLVRAVLLDADVGAVLHFAGSVVVPESVSDPLKYYFNNTLGSCSLIRSCVQTGVRHFVFSSTAAVYGIPPSNPVSEDMPTAPINPYGNSKRMVEEVLRDTAAAHPINYCALRYFNVAGADPAGRAGQSTAGATHLIKIAVEAALGKRDEVCIFGTDFETADGTGVRDYIHVDDLAQAHLQALDLLAADPAASHVMNCGYGSGYSVLEVLNTVERVSGARLKRRLCPKRAGDPDMLLADNRVILNRTRWTPRHDNLEVIVRDALRWERTLPDRSQPAKLSLEEARYAFSR
jgi:UDP-glucose 4-epimerase